MQSPVSLSPTLLKQIQQRAYELGFDHVAATGLEVPVVDQAAYSEWCDKGHAAGMTYMTENRDKRLFPATGYEGFTTVLTLAVSYFQGPVPPKPGAAYGR